MASEEIDPRFSEEELAFFESKIRPLLIERCGECHSDKAETIEAGLRLDSRRAMLTGGETGPAIVPGAPEKSLLIESVHYGGTYEMPPDSKLPAEDIELLEKWVAMGAPWPPEDQGIIATATETFSIDDRKASHWCWQPLERTTPPAVANTEWPRDVFDQFILHRLEQADLEPAGEAERNQWLRRVTFDLTGLPPTLDEIDAFLADQTPTAHERVVERLLSSPRFGEHWARYWMDLVRYGETKAFAQDYSAPFVFRYRDYLIRAYNADIAYDQFVREAMAGDSLQDPRLDPVNNANESVMGPGFVYLTDGHHGPADIHADEARVFDTIIDTTSRAFLAMTLSCCRCHDHKFDAISMQDYYSLYGIFASSRIDFANTVPQTKLFSAKETLRERQATIRQMVIADIQKQIEKIDVSNPQAVSLLQEQLKTNDAWKNRDHPLFPLTHILLASDDQSRKEAWNAVTQDPLREETAPQMHAIGPGSPDSWFPSGLAFDREKRGAGNIILAPDGDSIFTAITGSSWVAGDLASRFSGSLKSPTFQVPQKINLLVQGRHGRVRLYVQHYEMVGQGPTTTSLDIAVNQDAWHWISFDTRLWEGKRAYLELLHNGDQMQFVSRKQHQWKHEEDAYLAVRAIVAEEAAEKLPETNLGISAWNIEGPPPETVQETAEFFLHRVRQLLDRWENQTIDYGGEQILAALFATGGPWEARADRDTAVGKAVDEYRTLAQSIPRPIYARSLAEGPGEDEPIHIRGNPAAPSGEGAIRHFLDAIEPEPFTESGSGRRSWAESAVSTGAPLTARVEVNRIWYRLFGRGIVESVDNFGVKGVEPSHPQLLDRLAAEFVRSGWSRKEIIRRLVLSSTYRMATQGSNRAWEIDPANILLQHANVRRLPAEAIRDAVLAVSGSLNHTMYGIPIPINLHQTPPSRALPLKSGPLDGHGRRTVYQEMRRNYLPPLLLAFDLPQAAVSLGKRGVTNVPAQSLAMLNDPFIIQEAKRWAEQLTELDLPSAEDRIDHIHRLAFSRPATKEEISLAKQMLGYGNGEIHTEDATAYPSQEAWQNFCHLMLNRKEFIFVR
ncbi:MAG: PSD1 and planctomycete cytochrome C domain-containing protein [Pirellulales bacterium]|nr:PSD1 and planctomycete cytochrome C domain-containing protein [Pirellulales bacterium]